MECQTEQIAYFALQRDYPLLTDAIKDQLKRHLLDAVGSMLFALQQPTMGKFIKGINSLQGSGVLHDLSPDHAALLYTALIRYPDFMDNYLGKESTCHPSDNIGGLLAVSHVKPFDGAAFLTAMAVAYAIECRLVNELPVMINGFDHTTLLSFSVTASMGRLLGMDVKALANALGIAGCSFNTLVTTRASYTPQWKGFASALVNSGCMQTAAFSSEGITGPVELFEIKEKGFNAIHGMELKYDWQQEDFSLIPKCCLKSFNAEVHTQTALESVLALREQHDIDIASISKIEVTVFLTGYHIVGGGEYGDRYRVYTKEQADHSLPYLVAVALIDGKVTPQQLVPERIVQEDVQQLLKKVKIDTVFPVHKPVKLVGMLDSYTAQYPDKMCSKVTIHLKDGTIYMREQEDFKGFHTRPFSWEDTVEKFISLTGDYLTGEKQFQIINAVKQLETTDMKQLTHDILSTGK